MRLDVAGVEVYKKSQSVMNPLPRFRASFGLPRRASCALLAALSVLIAFQLIGAQESHKPLGEKEITDLLTNDVPPPRVGELAKQFGITFHITSSTEQKLRDAGATDSLIETLRQLSPKQASPPAMQTSPSASSPPVLLIVSSPGDAQVYIDDEPVGTTSSEGRLKMSKLGAGEHRVRVARSGYRDFEQTLQLDSGLVTVNANLEQVAAASSAASPPGTQQPQQAQAVNASPTAVLGLSFRPPGPGAQGGVVLALVPGGPAERAGIRPGFTILSIAGRSVMTAQDMQQATAGRQPGDVVPVTFSNGSGASTVQVALASPAIFESAPHFRVLHDHGPPSPNYCVGWMWVLDGMITYIGQTGVTAIGYNGPNHNLEFPMSDIREVKKNGFYMAALGAFHVRLKNGGVANFIVVDSQGRYQRPDELLAAVERALAND